MKLIEQGTNWVIIDNISDNLIKFTKEIISDADPTDFSDRTTAKGSVQNYLKNTIWLDKKIKEPKRWKELDTKFVEITRQLLVHYCKMPHTWGDIEISSAWTVTGKDKSFHTLHSHNEQHIVSVIYLDVPKKEKNYEGQINLILDANGYSNLGLPKHRILQIDPYPGLMLIFPGWILHSVNPQGPGTRQTVNIDFSGILIPGEYASMTTTLSSTY